MSWYPTYVNDLVSCSYWNKSKSETPYDANSTNVGYQWDSARKQINGYYDKWLGNYLSEHEEINFGFDINSPLDDVFVVHLNWYRGGAASIHVVITETEDEDLNPNPTGVVVRSFDTSAIAHGGKALITDGGFEISFSNDGSIENVDII